MELLSEHPTYLVGGLGLLAGAFLIALRITQRGRYLLWALAALGLVAAVLAIEHFWVTDAERVERVVYDLRDAVAASDSERTLSFMTADVEFVQGGRTIAAGEQTRAYIQANVSGAKFDFLRISHLKTEASPQSRRGSAQFRVVAGGSVHTPMQTYNFGTASSDWSLGFEETSPGVWKVNRISPTQAPRELPRPWGPGSGYRRRGGRSREGGTPPVEY
jgi:hypothetical protein